MSIRSKLTTLAKITEDRIAFNVPIYQRLYVWGDDQIETLLEDLRTAFQQGEKPFYLGGTLVVETMDSDQTPSLDLIDGQQRFTTLWMMSLVWREALEPFLVIPREVGSRPRISFPIRPDVDAFFAAHIRGDESKEPGNSSIVDALSRLESFRKGFGQPQEFTRFVSFVFEKVRLVLTRVPLKTDLNKLFEVINNRGVQLQHHEILKARLLRFLSNDTGERDRYATLWDACSHMPGYVERNLRDASGIRIANLFDNDESARGIEALGNADSVLTALFEQRTRVREGDALDVEAVLLQPYTTSSDKLNQDIEPHEAREVRSILSFPLLLQHTLRIWLARNNRHDLPRILDKQLLNLFSLHFLTSETGANEVRSFIRLLWETRYAFDKHIIKWVRIDKDEEHLICRLYLNTSEKSRTLQRPRPESNQPFALLQSMLYHSQQITTHYWLTPLLSYLLAHPYANSEERLNYLRHLDNHLLCSKDPRLLAERSNDFVRQPMKKAELVDIEAILSKPDGLRFPHYWFYKLEFVLWHLNSINLNSKEMASFRMTAKNSIEHISPQSPQLDPNGKPLDRDKVSPAILDTFGNLSLVSRSLNSEYGNKPYNEKQPHFNNRNRDRIDSLKMAAIYRSPTWGDDEAVAHQAEMITILKDYIARPTLIGISQTTA